MLHPCSSIEASWSTKTDIQQAGQRVKKEREDPIQEMSYDNHHHVG
jgi:hypothetical protein